ASQLRISAPFSSAHRKASSVLPTAVGPTRKCSVAREFIGACPEKRRPPKEGSARLSLAFRNYSQLVPKDQPVQYARNPTVKICLVTETFPPEINGVSMTLGRLVDGLSDRGHQLTIVAPQRADRPDTFNRSTVLAVP